MSIKKSFSLIEVLIFVTILSMFLVAAASIITVSMRQNTIKVNTIKAVHYNEQLSEWISTEKETEWGLFITRGTPAGNTYCFPTDALDWSLPVIGNPLDLVTGCSSTLENKYRRFATVTTIGSPVARVEVIIHSDWQEAGNTYKTELNTVYTLWE